MWLWKSLSSVVKSLRGVWLYNIDKSFRCSYGSRVWSWWRTTWRNINFKVLSISRVESRNKSGAIFSARRTVRRYRISSLVIKFSVPWTWWRLIGNDFSITITRTRIFTWSAWNWRCYETRESIWRISIAWTWLIYWNITFTGIKIYRVGWRLFIWMKLTLVCFKVFIEKYRRLIRNVNSVFFLHLRVLSENKFKTDWLNFWLILQYFWKWGLHLLFGSTVCVNMISEFGL